MRDLNFILLFRIPEKYNFRGKAAARRADRLLLMSLGLSLTALPIYLYVCLSVCNFLVLSEFLVWTCKCN